MKLGTQTLDGDVEAVVRDFMSNRLSRRRFIYDLMALGVSSSGAIAILNACQNIGTSTSTSSTKPVRTPLLRVGLSGPPIGFDPLHESVFYSSLVIGQVYSTLTRLDTNANPAPDLATSWDISPDGLTYTFHLRQGVKFHNGDDFTAADVKFTWDQYLDPKTGYSNTGVTSQIDHVEVVDPNTARMVLKRPFSPLLTALTDPLTSVRPMKAVQSGRDLDSNPIGTGPFAFTSYTQGSLVSLQRNNQYYIPGKPYFDRMEFHIISDGTARTNALLGNVIDFNSDVNPPDFSGLMSNPNLKTWNFEGGSHNYVGFNLTRKPFDELNVRMAIAYAIDRQSLIDGVFFGLAKPFLGGNIPSWSWAYDANLHPFSGHADLQKAKQFLSQSSVPNGFTLQYKTENVVQTLNDQVPILQQNLLPLGIKMTITVVPIAQFFETVFLKKDFDMMNSAWGGVVEPDDYAYLDYYSDSTWNIYGYKSPAMDAAVDAGRQHVDHPSRIKAYATAQQLQVADLPIVNTLNPYKLQAATKKFQGYTPVRTAFLAPLVDSWLEA